MRAPELVCPGCGRREPVRLSMLCGTCGATMIATSYGSPARLVLVPALSRSGGVEPPVSAHAGNPVPSLIASEGLLSPRARSARPPLERSIFVAAPPRCAAPPPSEHDLEPALEVPTSSAASDDVPSSAGSSSSSSARGGRTGRTSLGKVARDVVERVPCRWGRLDEAFGGGPAFRHVVMLGGVRGSGKTRLAVPVVAGVAASTGRPALYMSAEGQDAGELAAMLPRDVDADLVEVLEATELEALEAAVEELDPSAVAVDSMQSVKVRGTRLGSDEHARALLEALRRMARGGRRVVFALSQMNGAGTLRGSQLYQQLCDAVAMLERDALGRRVFRFDGKHRGGPDDRTAAFRFDDEGILRGAEGSEAT